MERIEEALQRLFQKYRVVFWYDEKKELTEQFQTLSLPGVEKMLAVVFNVLDVNCVSFLLAHFNAYATK